MGFLQCHIIHWVGINGTVATEDPSGQGTEAFFEVAAVSNKSICSHDHWGWGWMLVHHFHRQFPKDSIIDNLEERWVETTGMGSIPIAMMWWWLDSWTVPTTRYTLPYLWLSIQLQLQSSLIIFNIHLGSLGTGKSSTCKYLQDVFPTEDVDEKTGHVYRRDLKILLPSLQSGGGSGARLRAGSALATAAVGSWDIHQSWFKSDRGWHCQDTWPDGAGMGLGSENHFWSTGNNFGVQKISKGQVFRQVRHYLLSLAHWKLAPTYILLTSTYISFLVMS